MALNHVMLSGNLVQDAELRATAEGTEILRWTLAVDDRRKDRKTGEWVEQPGFFDCFMFGDRAAKLADYLVKGTKLAVEGQLRQDKWVDAETGSNRSKIEVRVTEIEFMSPKDGARARSSAPLTLADDDISF